jgi:uncharacterized membrane protein YebE (DUF533 family)
VIKAADAIAVCTAAGSVATSCVATTTAVASGTDATAASAALAAAVGTLVYSALRTWFGIRNAMERRAAAAVNEPEPDKKEEDDV